MYTAGTKVAGKFKILRFSLRSGKSPRLVLELDESIYSIYLRHVQKEIIGKTHLDITLEYTQGRQWRIYTEPNINVRECSRCGEVHLSWYTSPCCGAPVLQVSRPRRKVVDLFEAVETKYASSYYKRTPRMVLKGTDGKDYEVFYTDIFPYLADIYGMKKHIVLTECTTHGSYRWKVSKYQE